MVAKFRVIMGKYDFEMNQQDSSLFNKSEKKYGTNSSLYGRCSSDNERAF
jgi:hypothetical protein